MNELPSGRGLHKSSGRTPALRGVAVFADRQIIVRDGRDVERLN